MNYKWGEQEIIRNKWAKNEVSSLILIFDFINKLIEFNIKSSEDAGIVPEAKFRLSLIKQVSLIVIIIVYL